MAQPGPTDETTLAPAADTETRLSTGSDARPTGSEGRRTPSSSPHTGWLSTSQTDGGRFASGTILGDRYRIIDLAGRGGMGEVYRTDDLRLGQPVAMKFLPESVCKDPTRLAQFHNEVRTARQIAHRNVCRVYDIGEAEDRIFLTMEYVDGEDLATLLRRVGRFPSDRAVEIARQICAGLAAAHELNVLHRDLKPANVMLDADGRVRITDFGLAGLAGQIKDIRAGTPAYMAPEQLAGREVSVRSDIFALGLVLYEIFTGKRAFDAKNVAELLRMHDEGLALTPTAAVRDMDPAVERVILRCLDRDPQRRPASALAVAAALPGGDPLAAALAAGETPSPELVANAGHRDAIHPALGLTAVGVVLVLLTAVVLLLQQMLVMHRVPFDKTPDVLLDRAQSVRTSFGYHDTPADSASGFDIDGDYYNYVQKSRQGADSWREISSGRDPLTRFWYRTSPSPLKTGDVRERVTSSEPPFSVAGMKNLALDSRGRLIAFEAIPTQAEASETASGGVGPSGAPPDAHARSPARDASPTAPTTPNWDLLFATAELPKDRFTPTEPEWTPRAFADTRAAWAGTLPELGDTPVRVEAASYGGRITGFTLVFPWTEQRAASTGDQRSFVETLGSYLHILIELALVLASVFIARRNLRLGRGNPEGAFRIAVFTFAVELVSLFLKGNHVPILDGEVDRWYSQVAYAAFEAGKIWIYYLALEPIVRRYWPDGLITWNRLLAGRWRDPLVGWHLLCGVGCGLALAATLRFGIPSIELIERGAASPWVYPIFFVGNARVFAGLVAGWINGGVNTGLFVVMCYAIARGSRAAMGRNIVALGVMSLILAAVLLKEFIIGKNLPLEISFMLLVVVVILIAMLQFGVLALCVMFIINNLMNVTPFTLSSADWFAPTSFAMIAVVIGLAIAGFVISRGGEPLLGRAFAVE